MSDDGPWIVIPNWDRFQHYKDRDPLWIKLYTELLDKYEWQRLSFADRGLLSTAWLAYAGSNGVLHVSRMVALCGAHANAYGNLDKALKRLNDAGFVQLVASKPLSLARSREKRREEKKDRASAQHQNHPAPSTPRTPTNGPDRLPIGDVLRDLAADSPFAASFLTGHGQDTDGHHDDPPTDEQGRLEDEPGYF